MGARKFSGLLHELLQPIPGKLTLVYHSTLLYLRLFWRQSWIEQVEHWPDPLHHLRAAILPEVVILLQLHNVFLGIDLQCCARAFWSKQC
jgi:hypothetical protein